MNSEDQKYSSVHYLTVDERQAGQRIDNFLLRHLKPLPRSVVYRMLRNGEVRVNKGRVKPAYRLLSGDRVRVPPTRRQASTERRISVPAGVMRELQDRIVFEDEDLMVLHKPSGVPVHGGSGVPYGIIEILRQAYPYGPMLELAHRLDRATSGCLILAKTTSALRQLHTLLREGDVNKHYVALVRGGWRGGERTVDLPLIRENRDGGGRKVHVDERGRYAETTFVPRRRFEKCTLVDVQIHTGRTHQIRVHGAQIGHPLAGDYKYGDTEFNRDMRSRGLQRLFLHAESLAFRFPGSGKRYRFDCGLDRDLTQVLDQLGA